MKKTAAGITAAVLVLSIGLTSAFAASQSDGRNFTDADNDGICDNCSGFRPCVVADRHGSCDGSGSGLCVRGGDGRKGVGEDGDGACDANTTGTFRPRNGAGFQKGRRGGCGK